jgi:UDP-2-acetamido-2-deoxy-ribo-hexuluronate aminotransferase
LTKDAAQRSIRTFYGIIKIKESILFTSFVVPSEAEKLAKNHSMDFIDLKTQQRRIKEEIDRRIQAVLSHGQYIMGPEIRELEERLADFVGVRHALSCASGTDALLLALMAHNTGPGDAIFTTPFTFFATAEVISLLGATPIFVDIDPATFNIDPVQLEKAIQALKKGSPSVYPLPRSIAPNAERRTPNVPSSLTPRGIMAVDLFGLPAEYDRIGAIAAAHGLFVIEDAAQSFGAEYHGRKAGCLAELAGTSFFPAKPLGGYGDGGMCFTDDGDRAEILNSLRIHGQGKDKYENVRIGLNGRLDTLQAAVLLAKMDLFPEEIGLRQRVARRYADLLSSLSPEIVAPAVPAGYQSVWAQYSILSRSGAERERLLIKLKQAGIPTAVYYPKPLHLQTAFAYLGYREGDFPVSEDCARRIFSLPMHPYLAAEDQERIVMALKD